MEGPRAMVDRLVRATNEHDLDALVGCFSENYRNETPAHPNRGFQGRAQVRRNWEQIFAAVPDIQTEVVATAVERDTVWTEWDMRGTRRDGNAHHMRGVILFGVIDGMASWARFYLEPVDDRPAGIDQAVRQHLGSA